MYAVLAALKLNTGHKHPNVTELIVQSGATREHLQGRVGSS